MEPVWQCCHLCGNAATCVVLDVTEDPEAHTRAEPSKRQTGLPAAAGPLVSVPRWLLLPVRRCAVLCFFHQVSLVAPKEALFIAAGTESQ